MKLIEKFHDSEYNDDSVVKSPSNANVRCTNGELIDVISKIEKKEPTSTSTPDNLTQGERTALQELKAATDIVIKKADKGNTLVVMDTPFYRDKLVLADHRRTVLPPTTQIKTSTKS